MCSDKKPTKLAKVNQISRGVIQTVAGIVVTSPTDFVRIAANAGSRMLKSEFSSALNDTYSFFINNGKLDPKYFDSTEFADLAPDFGKIEDGDYGITQLNALRRMFANLALEAGTASNKKHLLEIALTMSELEFKVLIGDMELSKSNLQDEHIKRFAHYWARAVSGSSGLMHEELVYMGEDGLMNKRLFSPRTGSDKTGVNFRIPNGRLTSTGVGLYELLSLNDDPIKS